MPVKRNHNPQSASPESTGTTGSDATTTSSTSRTKKASSASDHRRNRRPAVVHVRAASRPGAVFVVPYDQVLQMPPEGDHTAKLLLCPYFDVLDVAFVTCPAGTACMHVHADLRGVVVRTPHERSAQWTTLADAPYPRYPSGEAVELSQPNRGLTVEAVDSGLMLRTRALDCDRRPLSHCAHFLFKGVCDLGADCQFVHVVRLPEAPALDVMSEHHRPRQHNPYAARPTPSTPPH